MVAEVIGRQVADGLEEWVAALAEIPIRGDLVVTLVEAADLEAAAQVTHGKAPLK